MDLTFEQFLEFTARTQCFYCESPIFWGYKKDKETHASNLDRKDNGKGYSKDNVVVCCRPCNFGKGARYTFEEWACMMKALLRLRKENNTDAYRAVV